MDAETERIITQVSSFVEPLYLVGGPVRDILLGKRPTDFDFATPLPPDEIEARIRAAGKHPFLIGKRFGTVGVRVEGQHLEITTFRTERYSPGSRKPEVAYVDDITHDLSRRDFTINALAWREGRLIDPFAGQQDLKAGIIRAVGRPGERFQEDPLRMLRAARFSAQLGFSVESETMTAASKRAASILEVSRERWLQELDKLLLALHPDRGLQVLAETRLLNFMLPELAIQVGYDQHTPYHELELWEHTKRVVAGVEAKIELRWAALLHDAGKPYVRIEKTDRSSYPLHERVSRELALKIGHYLRWPAERIKTVATLVGEHMDPGSPLEAADRAAKRA